MLPESSSAKNEDLADKLVTEGEEVVGKKGDEKEEINYGGQGPVDGENDEVVEDPVEGDNDEVVEDPVDGDNDEVVEDGDEESKVTG